MRPVASSPSAEPGKTSEEHIVRYSLKELLTQKDESDWERVEAMTDKEILADIENDPDWEGLTMLDFTGAPRLEPIATTEISLQIDDEVLAYFKSLGPDYQGRINAVLWQFFNEFGPKPDK